MQTDPASDSPRYRSVRLSRRRALSLLAGAAATGLSGCLGGGDAEPADGSGSGDGDGAGDAGGDAGDGQGAGAATAAASTTQRDDLPSAADFDCTTLGMPAERYDAGDSPLVFSFEHPEGWIVEPRETPSAVGFVVRAPVVVETGGYLYDVTVDQSVQASSPDYFDQVWDDGWEELGTLSFRGEERRIVELSAGDPGRVILGTVLPDVDGEYWYAGVDCQNLSFDEACFPTFRAIGEAVVESFEPR